MFFSSKFKDREGGIKHDELKLINLTFSKHLLLHRESCFLMFFYLKKKVWEDHESQKTKQAFNNSNKIKKLRKKHK